VESKPVDLVYNVKIKIIWEFQKSTSAPGFYVRPPAGIYLGPTSMRLREVNRVPLQSLMFICWLRIGWKAVFYHMTKVYL